MPNKSLLTYEIYTDGSTKNNGSPRSSGGWAYCILYDGDIKYRGSGCVLDTTNQRMELQAVIEALKICEKVGNKTSVFHFYSDSAYLINCYLQGWYVVWEKNNWRNASKKPVANSDLWGQIIPYFKRKSFFFHKVAGHADNYYNNLVDNMAQSAAEALKQGR